MHTILTRCLHLRLPWPLCLSALPACRPGAHSSHHFIFIFARAPPPALPPVCQVHAEGEAEHAAIGHNAVVTYVPAGQEPILRRAMLDHDRDFAAFYNKLADMLE